MVLKLSSKAETSVKALVGPLDIVLGNAYS